MQFTNADKDKIFTVSCLLHNDIQYTTVFLFECIGVLCMCMFWYYVHEIRIVYSVLFFLRASRLTH